MQSLNKMPSFGDDTLSACIQAEIKDMDIVCNNSDLGKYFKDSTFLAKIADKSNDIDKHSLSKQDNVSHSSMNTKASSNQGKSELGELRKNTIIKSTVKSETNVSSKSKTRSIASLKRNHGLSQEEKENVNYRNTDLSCNTNTLSKQCNKPELSVSHTDNSNIRSNATTNITSDTTDTKLFNSSVASSNAEKSSKISPISTIGTQDRCKLASWNLPPNILQVIYLHSPYVSRRFKRIPSLPNLNCCTEKQ